MSTSDELVVLMIIYFGLKIIRYVIVQISQYRNHRRVIKEKREMMLIAYYASLRMIMHSMRIAYGLNSLRASDEDKEGFKYFFGNEKFRKALYPHEAILMAMNEPSDMISYALETSMDIEKNGIKKSDEKDESKNDSE